MRRDQRGQTAAELLGVLLVIAAIVGAVVATGVGGRIAGEIHTAVCQIAGKDCHVAAGGAKPGDLDGDGLSDADERRAGLDPANDDSDADGIPDGKEIELGTDPASADSDGDGVSDRREATSGGKLDPNSADSDGDGLTDGEELALGTNPSSKDSDGFDTPGDGLTDAQEIELGTDPNSFDSDGDGNPDGYEVERGDDPTKDGRSILSKGLDALVLDDPVSLLLPSGPLAKALGKGFERFAVAAKGAIKALREAKTLEEAAAARRRLLALWRSRGREVPDGTPRPAATPPPSVNPERQELLEQLARKLERKRIAEEYKDRIDELLIDPATNLPRPLEATDAVILESQGRLRGLRRPDPDVARENGADFVEANGKLWDHKQAISSGKWNQTKFLDRLEKYDLANGEDIILNVSQLSAADLAPLQKEIHDRGWTRRFILIR
ncbi:hypothetical protein [Solirubrobacter soli]|uniref:hypothetical protein n=1 Tax=Solirubrobacter soli TaxID=363832 RepID=UPI0003F57409|nr:hypothetical protein [Solirubrobacter soli]